MKAPKLILASIALCVSLASFSQTDTTKRDTTSRRDTTSKRDSSFLNTQSASDATIQQSHSTTTQQAQSTTSQSQAGTATPSSSTTATSANSAHETAPKPNFGRYYIPVLGSYTASDATAENKSVTISGDESNPGKIWIEGVGTSKFYALLKTLPGTYKVPAQNQETNNIQEGTVIYDESTKQINICVGCGFKDADPSQALATNSEPVVEEKAVKGKTKKAAAKAPVKKVITFSGVKADQTTASNN